MRIIKTCLVIMLMSGAALADTQDYIKCDILYKIPNILYFNVGSSDGVVPGEEFEVYYDERIVAQGKIDWADKNISRSAELDSNTFADIYYYDELSAKIRLYRAISNKGGYLTIPYFTELELEPWSIDTPDEKMVARLIHRGLMSRDKDGFIIPDLANEYEVRGLTYTFYLDNEAVFHSGKPVEATDVAYSIEQLAKSSKLTPASSYVLAIRGAREFRHGARSIRRCSPTVSWSTPIRRSPPRCSRPTRSSAANPDRNGACTTSSTRCSRDSGTTTWHGSERRSVSRYSTSQVLPE